MIEYLTAVETVEKNPILKYENRIEVVDSNIIRFKSKTEEQQKVPPKEQEAQEMKIQGITIFKNKKCSTWYTRYRKDGKQHYLSGKTQKEVAEKLKEKLNIIKKEKLPYTTFEKWYNQWLALFKIGKVKDSTIQDYKKSMKYVPATLLQKDIKKISSIDILQMLNTITAERTRQKVYELVKELFHRAELYKIILSNPVDLIDRPKYERNRGIALMLDEQKIFIHQCHNILHGDLLLLALYEGLRVGEVLALTGNDIDMHRRTIRINKSFNTSNKLDTTKNKQSNRLVPIFEPAIEILQKYTNLGEERIFAVSYYTARDLIKKAIAGTKLPDISCHDLRHTFITNCKNSEIPEHVVQSWVGHEIGSSVTKTVYTHITDDANNLFINKLNHSNFYSNSTHK